MGLDSFNFLVKDRSNSQVLIRHKLESLPRTVHSRN